MTLEEFTRDPQVLKGIDIDKSYGVQCWDLVEDYAERVLKVPKEPWAITLGPESSAKEAWKVFDTHMQKYFTKQSVGQRGDIAVYDGHGVYTEGHIAIYLGGGLVFEANADPDGSLPHVYTRATSYLLGYLRPNTTKGDIVDKDNTIQALTAQRDTVANKLIQQELTSKALTEQRDTVAEKLIDLEKSNIATGKEVTLGFLIVLNRQPTKEEYVTYTTNDRKVLNEFLFKEKR